MTTNKIQKYPVSSQVHSIEREFEMCLFWGMGFWVLGIGKAGRPELSFDSGRSRTSTRYIISYKYLTSLRSLIIFDLQLLSCC